jgi:hypothetical protein
VCVCVCVCVCVYIYMCVYVCVCVCVFKFVIVYVSDRLSVRVCRDEERKESACGGGERGEVVLRERIEIIRESVIQTSLR